ncbi:MAG: DUF4159 domain-containing protein [Planctomycetes bacterium]|nr:DUF4159 domain-containing protein [Planctomycetota bacterium]
MTAPAPARTRTRTLAFALVLPLALLAAPVPAPAEEVTGADVARAIENGIAYLRDKQAEFADEYPQFLQGPSALRALALATAGLDPKTDPLLLADLQVVTAAPPKWTYSVALEAMLLAMVDPAAHRTRINDMARWLLTAQTANGAWTYQPGMNRIGDNSNTQFALLGLYAAQEAGLEVPATAWERAVKYFSDTQNADGGWGYVPGNASIASMTAAGAASLLISQNRLAGARQCGDQPSAGRIQKALGLVGKYFDDFLKRGFSDRWPYYYLYAIERVGILSGRKYLGGRDWYREGATFLVRDQNADGSWGKESSTPCVETAFALLFLAKGHTPLLVNKLEWEGDWNNDPSDLKNLLEFSARRLNRRFSWQVVSTREPAEEFGFAPVLYLNGHTAPKLAAGDLEKVRAFLEQGGLLFAECCCDRPEFDRGFRDLIDRLMPGRRLERLGPDHAVYRVQFQITDPALQFLEGVTYACRTAIIYSPRDLSCAWDLGCPYKNAVPEEKAAELGMNVLLHGMRNVPLRDKLERKGALSAPTDEVARNTFVFAQLRHQGDWNPDPEAWTRLREKLSGEQGVRCLATKRAIAADDPNLANYPFLYLTGHDPFTLSEPERARLREHLNRGGMLFAESCCGKDPFNASLRQELAALYPQEKLEPVPPDDPLRRFPYPVGAGRLSPAAGGVPGPGRDLVGLRAGGRWRVLYSPVSILCPVDGHPCPDCRCYVAEDALHLAANIVVYALSP